MEAVQDVEEFAVVGLPRTDLAESVAAVVATKNGASLLMVT